MALLWFDGFESYQHGDIDDIVVVENPLFSQSPQYSYCTVNNTAGRGIVGTYGLRISNHTGHIDYFLSNNYTSFIIGFATYQYTIGTPYYNLTYPLLGLYDGSTLQFGLFVSGTEIQARNGDGTLLGTTSGAGLDFEIWRYVELKITIDNSVGVCIVRVGEKPLITLSNQDTQNTANAYFNKIRFGSHYQYHANHDDIYFCDTTGSKNNDFLGDVRVDSLRPNEAGTYSQFTPLAGSNYQNVDEAQNPDDDTTYNESSTVGHKDSYGLGDLPSPPSSTPIFGVKSQITIRKSDAGGARAKLLTKAGSTEDLGNIINVSDTYTTHTKIYEDNPDDSNYWEDADVNAMEVGVVIVAVTTTTTT